MPDCQRISARLQRRLHPNSAQGSATSSLGGLSPLAIPCGGSLAPLLSFRPEAEEPALSEVEWAGAEKSCRAYYVAAFVNRSFSRNGPDPAVGLCPQTTTRKVRGQMSRLRWYSARHDRRAWSLRRIGIGPDEVLPPEMPFAWLAGAVIMRLSDELRCRGAS